MPRYSMTPQQFSDTHKNEHVWKQHMSQFQLGFDQKEGVWKYKWGRNVYRLQPLSDIEIGDIGDVSISNLQNNQALAYNETSESWENKEIGGDPEIQENKTIGPTTPLTVTHSKGRKLVGVQAFSRATGELIDVSITLIDDTSFTVGSDIDDNIDIVIT